MKRFVRLFCAGWLALSLLAGAAWAAGNQTIEVAAALYPVNETGAYDSLEEVAVYLHTFGCLPGNFLTKREAQALGWDSRAGNLWRVAPGMSIGGDYFGNYEGNLKPPDQEARSWTECDIGFEGGFRDGRRLVFSGDGLIYYTEDHYRTFQRVLVITDAPVGENH